MDRRGGCCIARYAYDISKLDKIMLRFRPIAPKPASANSGYTSPESASSGLSVKSGRGKRKRAGPGKRCSQKRRCSPEKTESGTGGEKDTTMMIKNMPLLPEAEAEKRRLPLWLSFEKGGRGHEAVAAAVVASWVRVECVTDTWQEDGYPYGGIGRTDEERVRSLESDACPGLVSDGLNRVRWTNGAYRRMVAGGGEVAAWLVMEEGVALPPPVGFAAFTCRVRVVTCGNEKTSKTVPCDVWRMDCGWFAWRLDTAAALSLWVGN